MSRHRMPVLEGRVVGLGGLHGRAVMELHQPFRAEALEDVGGEHLGAERALVAALGKILLGYDHREVAADHHALLGDLELHLEDAVEDALPAIHDRAPSGALAPSGMDADDFWVAEPYAFHVLAISRFERPVEEPICFDHFFFL